MILFYISAVSAYTSALKSSIIGQTEFQPKLLASRTISNAKTDEIFTNLLIQHGRKALIRSNNDETYYSRSEELEYYGKVSGTPVKHASEIFLGVIDDQESANSILVVGKAGIGKSLFCQKVIRDWANNELFQARENTEIPNLKFVYLLSFRQLNLLENNCVTLREILNCCSALDDKCNIDDSTFEYILKHPKEVMIILDGYDEYSQQDYIAGNLEEQHPNDARRKMPVAALCSKLIKGKILKGAIVMITSRPDESDKMGGMLFKRYVEITGFSSVQVEEFIEKYFEKDENVKNAVLKHVMNNENLVSLAHIPMLCYLLCFEMEYTLAKSENPHDLPVSTTDIYTKLVDIFELRHNAESKYRQKQIPRDFKPPSGIKETLDKLSKLAAKLLVERKPTFDESEIEGNLEAEEVKQLKSSGLLYCGQPFRTELLRTTRHFSFTHLTVQEFLAARCFVKENRVPDKKCSNMVYQFMAGVLSRAGNEKLMEKLLDLPFIHFDLKMTCLNEYQNKEFAKKFIRNNPRAFGDYISLYDLSDVDCIGVSFVLDIISELNKEEAGEAQHKCSDKFFAVKKLELRGSRLTRSGIQRLYNSLNNEHCLVSELLLHKIPLTDDYADVLKRVVVGKLSTLRLMYSTIANTVVASLRKALQHPSCKLTTLELVKNEVNFDSLASLFEALQHPSSKLTTLELNFFTLHGSASLWKALQHPSCKLTTLSLEVTSINVFNIATLCEALQYPSCTLTTLILRLCRIDAEIRGYTWSHGLTESRFARLCEALQHSICTLTTLVLGFTSMDDRMLDFTWPELLGDLRFAKLFQVLQRSSCTITTLVLGLNTLNDTRFAHLCGVLQRSSCNLTKLAVYSNPITDTGFASLCEALQHPSFKLTTLKLLTKVSPGCRASLQAITQRHRPALHLSFGQF